MERAAFLLREVFDYGYDEIAAIIERSEAASRQIVHRARQRVAAARLRFHASRAEAEALTVRFLAAAGAGGLEGCPLRHEHPADGPGGVRGPARDSQRGPGRGGDG